MARKEVAPAFERQVGAEGPVSVSWMVAAVTEVVANPRATPIRAAVIARIRSDRNLLAWE